MKRDSLEAFAMPNWLVRSHKHSPDTHGPQGANFAKAMSSVQSIASAVRHRAEEPRGKPDSRVGPPENGNLVLDAGERAAPRIFQSGQLVESVLSPPEPVSTRDNDETVPEVHMFIHAVARGVAVDVPPAILAPVSRPAAQAVEELAEVIDPPAPEPPAGNLRVEHTPRLPSDRATGQVTPDTRVRDPKVARDRAPAASRIAFALSHRGEHAPQRAAPAVIAGEMHHPSPAIDGNAPARGHPPQRIAPSAYQPKTEGNFDHMSVRVDVSVESIAVRSERESDSEVTAAAGWDIVKEQLRHDARPLSIPEADAAHEDVPDDPGSSPHTADAAPATRSLPSFIEAYSLHAMPARTNADLPSGRMASSNAAPPSRLEVHASRSASPAHEDDGISRVSPGALQGVVESKHGNSIASGAQSQKDVTNAPPLSGFALRAGPAIGPISGFDKQEEPLLPDIGTGMPLRMETTVRTNETKTEIPANNFGKDREARAAEIGTGMLLRNETAVRVIETKAELSPLNSRAPDLPHGESERALGVSLAAPPFADHEAAPALAKPTSLRSDWQAGAGNVGDGDVSPRRVVTQVMPREGEANDAIHPKPEPMRGVDATGNERVEWERGWDGDIVPLVKRETTAAAKTNVLPAKEERQNSPQPSSTAGSSSAPFSPLRSNDGAQSVGQAMGEHGGGAPPHSLGQILSTLRLELSAFKKIDGAPMKQLKIRLHPESLGEVDVTLKKNGRGIEVRLDASLASTASALRATKDELASALAELGFDRPGLSIDVKTIGQGDVQLEASGSRDLQQGKPDIDQRNLTDQHGDRRRERTPDEGRNEKIERDGRAVGNGSASRSKRGIYV